MRYTTYTMYGFGESLYPIFFNVTEYTKVTVKGLVVSASSEKTFDVIYLTKLYQTKKSPVVNL